MREWNKKSFGNIFENKSNLKDDVKTMQDRIQQVGYSEELVKEENEKLVEYHDIISKEETFWRQSSRSIWLKEGDRNTQKIHLNTMKHRAKNLISSLSKGREKITNEIEISNEMLSYFYSFLTSDQNVDSTR